uniref:Uncharacterized protein n=1 Tax=Oryza sativa subsp. japonica TaxID=39947 RepID=Q6YUL2_ORYSJ|nr:hypothetical protein [Oryza sativa Japonica Group]BAD16513.1 hypothetical protein [Oryza sativa Japonica Group]
MGEEGGEAPKPVARLVKRASRVKVKSPGGRCSAWAVRQRPGGEGVEAPEPVAKSAKRASQVKDEALSDEAPGVRHGTQAVRVVKPPKPMEKLVKCTSRVNDEDLRRAV